jgi:predicted glutamine amidotransferase
MCGLAGFARQKGFGDVRVSLAISEELLRQIAHRGRHATGFAAVNTAGEAEIWKKAVAVETAMRSDSWKEAMDKVGGQEITIFIGHVRYSTHYHNKDKDEAAHPFYENGVVGAHNGVISNWKEVGKKLDIGKDWDVDSQAAIGALARLKSPVKALRMLDGWFALTWVKKGKLFMVKSKGSPLACAYVPHVRTLFWCSEMKVLREVVDKAIPEKYKVDFYELADERLYEYNVNYFGESSNVKKTEVALPMAGSHRKPQPADNDRRGNLTEYWKQRGWDAEKGVQIPMPFDDKVPTTRSLSFGEMELLLRKQTEGLRQMWTFIANQNSKIAKLERELEQTQKMLGDWGFYEEEPEAEPEKPVVQEHHGQADGVQTDSTSSTSTSVTTIPAAVEEIFKCRGCGQPGTQIEPLFSDGRGGLVHDTCVFDGAYAQ